MLFKIKPAKNLQVLDPLTKKPLKSTGETKQKTEYWCRRVLDGSVTEVKSQEKKGEKNDNKL